MREVQLRQMRQRKTVWVLGALVLLALGALWWWAAQRPPSIVPTFRRASTRPTTPTTPTSRLRKGLEPLREWLPKLQSPKTLEALVALAHDAEKRRTPLRSIFTHEYYFGLAFHRDLAQGRLKLQDLERDWGFSSLDPPTLDALLLRSGVGAPFVVKPSLREYQHYYDQLFAELEKPPWERKPVPANPKRFLNQLLFPVFDGATKREQSSTAILRLLACYAAVKRYYQQRGAYPPSLEALRPQLGELIIDPFTGMPFVYRTNPKRGFHALFSGREPHRRRRATECEPTTGRPVADYRRRAPRRTTPQQNAPIQPVWLR
jgi:hypothetical protein